MARQEEVLPAISGIQEVGGMPLTPFGVWSSVPLILQR